MKNGVMRPGHVQIRVLDLDEAVKHYTELMGLIETDRDDQDRVYLKGWTEVDKYSLVLRKADEAGMDFMGFKVLDEDALNKLEASLNTAGFSTESIDANELKGCGRRVQFEAPSGHLFELYAVKEHTGKWGVSDVNPEAWPRDLKGMQATRFDHALLYGPNVEACTALFCDVLGFGLSEQVVDPEGNKVGSFMSSGMKAHDIAFIDSPEKGKLHHTSYFLETWESVLKAADLISMTDTPIDIGPTRHGLTHGQTIYFFDPSGNRCEVFCGGNYYYPDHKPITWKAEDLGKAIFYHDRVLNERFLTVVT